nr:uncharacterized protein LOC108082353 isoform X4 [Drosophila kikkawai]
MLRKCCYCIELRKACIVISIIDFIFNIAILSIPDRAGGGHLPLHRMLFPVGRGFDESDRPADLLSYHELDQHRYPDHLRHRPGGE